VAWLTDKNVRLLVGFVASLVLLALILADALDPAYSLEQSTIYLLGAIIWAFLGIDILRRVRDGADGASDGGDSAGRDRPRSTRGGESGRGRDYWRDLYRDRYHDAGLDADRERDPEDGGDGGD